MEKNYETALAKKGFAQAIDWRKAIMLCLLVLAVCAPIFGVETPSGKESGINQLDSFADTFFGIFTSRWVQIICIIALIIIGIMTVAGFQNGGGAQVFKTFVPWAIGVILVMSASSITNFLWNAAGAE